jgi:hypothetical protein
MRNCMFSFCFVALLATGCNNTTTVSPAGGPVPDGAVAPDDLAGMTPPPVATTAVVTTSSLNFMGGGGSINTVRLADKMPTHSVKGGNALDTSIDVDNVVRAAGGKVYVLDRTHGSLRIYDPSQMWMNPVEIATGDATASHDTSDPADVIPGPAGTKLYVALYGNDAAHAVGVIDPSQPGMGVVKWIAIPVAGSPLVRASGFWSCGPSLYVLLGDLDAAFKVTGTGRIAVIDPGADTVSGVIMLQGTNPGVGLGQAIASAAGPAPAACDVVLVAHAGDFNQMDPTKKGGGIELVDLTGRKSMGMVLSTLDLGGGPMSMGATANSISTASPTLAYAVINLPSFSQQVLVIDPSAKKVLGMSPVTMTVAFAQVTPDGKQLYVGVENGMMGGPGAGLYIVDATNTITLSGPIDLGQASYGVSFY